MGRCAAVLSAEGFWCSRATPECPGANRPDGPQGLIRSRSPPISRVGRDAAGIAEVRTAVAAPPRTPYFSPRISIARPLRMINIMRRFNNLERDRTQKRIALLLIALVKPHPGAKPLTVGCAGSAYRPF